MKKEGGERERAQETRNQQVKHNMGRRIQEQVSWVGEMLGPYNYKDKNTDTAAVYFTV